MTLKWLSQDSHHDAELCPWYLPYSCLALTSKQLLQFKECVLTKLPLILCSDGGVANTHGTFGWVCAQGRSRLLASGKGTVYGSPRFMHPFRAEAMGAYVLFRFLHLMAEVLPSLLSLPIEWHCDNLGLVDAMAFSQQSYFRCRPKHGIQPDYDLLIPLRALMKPFSHLGIYHVSSHQDKKKKPAELTVPERWNVFIDRLAGKAYDMPSPPSDYFPVRHTTSPCLLTIQSIPVTTSINSEL